MLLPLPSNEPHDYLDNQDSYDVIVVGASFAGLSFASVGAALGLRVLVLERDGEVGGVVRTTGVLFSDVLDYMDVPARFLMNAIRRIQLQPPDRPAIEVSSRAYRFYMVDVPGMLQWMAAQAEERGATVRCNTMFLDAACDTNGLMSISASSSSDGKEKFTFYTRFLIGADGTRSRVAKCMELDQNTHYLAGAEWLIDNVQLDRETFYLIMNHELAPGYCVWLAPHGDIVALGVAGHARDYSPTTSLKTAQTLFQDVADLSNAHVVERKAGVIPTGGRLRRVYRDDSRGKVLLLGDAAGLCGAATGGGIYPALISGKVAARAVANAVLNGDRGAIKAYERNVLHAGRLGHYLRIEDWLRWALDSMKSDADVSMLYSFFETGEGRKLLQRTLFETPIIGMDGNLLSLLRSLLGQHPRLYGSAFQSVWRRVTTRGRSATPS
ncbi:MAG TPA: NAD(P)/FAD-dependent oxidoreductase [Ktedonobacteraceae bacterium]|nr:NAD(P)/FAD-dependent oxidoreductase [Ktedonobacteraceae bacterium]